ncbi:hypothetical protein [Vibrio phage BONAISHI]|nr:hypothetical protein [Vibrio phage BONAISHI]
MRHQVREIVITIPGIMHCLDLVPDSNSGWIVINGTEHEQEIIGEAVFEMIFGLTFDQVVDKFSPLLDEISIARQEVLGDHLSEIAVGLDNNRHMFNAYTQAIQVIFSELGRDLKNKLRVIDPNNLGLMFYR